MSKKIPPIVNEGYQKALEVLHMNVTPLGFSATTEKHVNYYSVWARDHCITALAAIQTDDTELITAAKKGVLLLLQSQSDSGQVPSYIEIEKRKKIYGGLGTITSIDSNLWIGICAAEIYKKTKDKRFISDKQMQRYKRLYRLIRAFDSNNCGLLEVHPAGDWADIFNRTYHVLYDECLHYKALKSLQYLFDEKLKKEPNHELSNKWTKLSRWMKRRRKRIKPILNSTFLLNRHNVEKVKEKYMIHSEIDGEYPFYQSHLAPFKNNWHHRFETLGNSLAILTGIASQGRSKSIISYALENKIDKPFPMTALSPPVYENEFDWEPIYATKETPYAYHNGGIWPMISGFWIAAIVKNKRPTIAKKQLVQLTEHLKDQYWTFNEYMNGKTGEPMGRNFQAWSAAGYILAYNAVFESKQPFSD